MSTLASASYTGTASHKGVIVGSVIAGFLAGGIFFSVWSSRHSHAAPTEQTPLAAPVAVAPAAAPGNQRVVLTEAQCKDIQIQTVTEQAVAMRLGVNARVGFDEDHTLPLLAPIAGHVTDVKVRVGNQVKKGDELCSLKSREVAAMESEYQESRKDCELATKTYAMTADLFKGNAASKIALQQSENDLAKAKTRVKRCEEQLRVLGLDPAAMEVAGALQPTIVIRAPRDGTIVDRRVTDGQFVQGDGTPLFTLSDLSNVWVMADVFERDLHAIRLNQPADVSTLAYPNQRFAGQVTYISNTVDPQTRTVKVRIVVPNPDGRLKPEMFAMVELVLDQSTPSLVVSDNSVITDDGKACVYVKTGPRAFTKRNVEVVSAGPGQMKVLRGLRAGEQVVSHGPLMLRNIESAPAQDG